MDRVAFTLDRPQSSKAGLVRVLASPKDSSNKSTPLQPPSTENNGKMSRAQTRSSINAEGEKGALSRYYYSYSILNTTAKHKSSLDFSATNANA